MFKLTFEKWFSTIVEYELYPSKGSIAIGGVLGGLEAPTSRIQGLWPCKL